MIDNNDNHAYLTFGRALAAQARRVIAHYGRDFKVSAKPDGSFVSEVDVAVERALRESIAARFPAHAVQGEELPATQTGAEFTWLIDPIDGTDNFVHGVPTYGCIIGLHRGDEPVMGVIDHPALNLCYSAARGLGAFCNERRIRVDDFAHVTGGEPIVALAAPANFLKTGELGLLERVQQLFPNTRGYRDCFAHTRVAQGSVAAMAEVNVSAWDLAATQVLIEEAGGVFIPVATPNGRAGYVNAVFGDAAIVRRLAALLQD